MGAAGVCLWLGTTAGTASANLLPGPAPALMWMDAATAGAPPNYPAYDPDPEVVPAPDPSDGGVLQWLPAGAAIGVAGGVLWLHRRWLAAH